MKVSSPLHVEGPLVFNNPGEISLTIPCESPVSIQGPALGQISFSDTGSLKLWNGSWNTLPIVLDGYTVSPYQQGS